MFKEKSDSEKLCYLFENFGNSMYAVADRVLNDAHLAEDVVQEVLIRVFREEIMEKIDAMEEGEMRAYLLMTARNIAINVYTKRKRECGVTFADYNEESLKNIAVEDCAEMVLRKLEEENLFKIVKGMPEKYSYVLISKYKYELSDKQIAAACGITETAVRKRLERGRKMLLERLEERHYLDDKRYNYRKAGD